ncbi:MAG: hypothetical protein K8T91_01945 [Planctomycetes bacterium]|nr:hypothetical protein [Planctomycetota bacterium]
MAGQGVTPENNAAVPLMQVLGYCECDRFDASKKNRNAPCDQLLDALGTAPLPPDQRLRIVEAFVEYDKEAARSLKQELSRASSVPWKPEQFPKLSKFLTANNAAIDRIVEASNRPQYFVPRRLPVPDAILISIERPDVLSIITAAKQLLARGMLRLGEERISAGADDLVACHRLGRLIGQEPDCLSYLVGSAVEAMAQKGEAAMAHYCEPSPKAMGDYRLRLKQLPPRPQWRDKFLSQRLIALDAITALALGNAAEDGLYSEGREPDRNRLMRLYDVDEMLRVANGAFDEVEAAYESPSLTQQGATKSTFFENWNHLQAESKNSSRGWMLLFVGARQAASRHKIYPVVDAFLLPLFSGAKVENEFQRKTALGDVVFELAAYRAKHGHYPDSLKAIGSHILSDVPQNLFAHAPVEYKRTEHGYTLRSSIVLPNGKSDEEGFQIEMPIPPRKAEE